MNFFTNFSNGQLVSGHMNLKSYPEELDITVFEEYEIKKWYIFFCDEWGKFNRSLTHSVNSEEGGGGGIPDSFDVRNSVVG